MEIRGKLREIEKELGKLSSIHKILLGTDGSVTKMLEVLTGHPVEITTRLQRVVCADRETAERLEIEEGTPVNHRIVELRDAEIGEVLVYAISYTPLSRLSPEFRNDLMRADVPIGRIMMNHRIEARREILDAHVLPADANLSNIFRICRDEPLLSRRYKIIHKEQPLIAIEETFPYHRFLDESQVIVEAPSRIHLGLIDMNGTGGRVDGGIGITLDDPRILLEARRSETIDIKGGDEDCRNAVRQATRQVLTAMRVKSGVEITLRRIYSRHIGLGSGTQLALSTARAVSELFGRSFTEYELAQMMGRGGTSGIGTAAFRHGGFIIDGGHSFGAGADKFNFSPSSASRGVKPAPVTVQHPFPRDWRILLAIPNLPPGASEKREVDIFRKFCPIPQDEVHAVCHEVLMRMLPGLADHDIALFGSAVNRLQDLGFKKVELDLQPPAIPALLKEMREAGAVCAGMSSFGPTLYAIGDCGMNEVERAAQAMMKEMGGGETLITSGRNQGADLRLT